MVWEKTKDVMEEFVEYMQNEHILLYASNCGHAGWEHPDYQDGLQRVGHKVGDKIICVLMVGALYYMNGWHTAQHIRQQEDATNASIREHLRCIIVHMFSQVLNESVCRSKWATFYAWHIMEQLGKVGGFSQGLIQRGKCGRNISAHLKIRELELNAQVKQWLGQNSKLKEAIQKIQGKALCTTPWQEEWSIDEILGHGNIDDSPRPEIAQIMHGLKAGMAEVFKGIKQDVEHGIEKRAQAKKDNLAKDDKRGQAATKPATPSPHGPSEGVDINAGPELWEC
ncbi:hypothetical protein AK88_02515 [Plasmodium fragile]|uniref:Schizont-infected cell agglutination extracellular alpha domain-containing protein n=1 Tax=Plasmodium fragile TaxID=5857 RepID=A0A0D9QDN9_PLAFR|nr:uncharacterized protein AK88_02515 [Plasmodium fragile]XP_012338268.1 uncharacterized protein AK88_05243 [Plasmodium fragile]KJP85118.1 hypothetical protein AK88_05243 [Plasmodium fragile]KJP87759.1 hypothetical protein AK88_02515 [Plasmodium fragile]